MTKHPATSTQSKDSLYPKETLVCRYYQQKQPTLLSQLSATNQNSAKSLSRFDSTLPHSEEQMVQPDNTPLKKVPFTRGRQQDTQETVPRSPFFPNNAKNSNQLTLECYDRSAREYVPLTFQSIFNPNQVAPLLNHSLQVEQTETSPPTTNTVTPPNDYLESSEQLLRVLSAQELIKQPDKNWTAHLLTPLGLSSTFIFLGANILLASALLLPGKLSLGNSQNLFNAQSSTATASTASTTEIASAQLESPTELNIANVPNLATEEFINLDLSSTITLKVNTNSSIAASQSKSTVTADSSVEVIPGAYSDLAAALLPPSMRPYLIKSYVVQPTNEPVFSAEIPGE